MGLTPVYVRCGFAISPSDLEHADGRNRCKAMGYRQRAAKLVLLVEADPITRTTAVNRLEDAGYEVLEAGDADDAIHQLEAFGEDVVGLLANLTLSGSMNGLELMAVVSDRWPHIRPFVRNWPPM